MHDKKQKGDVGVLQVAAELSKQEWVICFPTCEHATYDFIAEKNGRMVRVQSRFTSKRNGGLEVKLKSTWADRHGNHIRKREKSDFDVLAVYCPETNESYFIKSEDFDNRTSIALRIDESICSTANRLRMAKNYRLLTYEALVA